MKSELFYSYKFHSKDIQTLDTEHVDTEYATEMINRRQISPELKKETEQTDLTCFRQQNAYASARYCPTQHMRWRSCRRHTAISWALKILASTTVFRCMQPSGAHFFLSTPQQPLVGHGLVVTKASRSHTDTRQSVRFLRTGDRPVYLTQHTVDQGSSNIFRQRPT